MTPGELAIRRDEILEALGLRAKSGTNRKNLATGETISPVPKTTADIAKEMGVGERTLQHNKQLARDLVPEAKEAVREKQISKNLKRRHLTTGQRAMVAEQLANMPRGGDRKSENIKVQNCTLVSQEEAAKQLNVSERSVKQARKVRTDAVPEVAVSVSAGAGFFFSWQRRKTRPPAGRL